MGWIRHVSKYLDLAVSVRRADMLHRLKWHLDQLNELKRRLRHTRFWEDYLNVVDNKRRFHKTTLNMDGGMILKSLLKRQNQNGSSSKLSGKLKSNSRSTKSEITAFCWVIRQRVLLNFYRRFGTIYRSHLQVSLFLPTEDENDRLS